MFFDRDGSLQMDFLALFATCFTPGGARAMPPLDQHTHIAPFGASPKWVVSLSSPPAHPRQPPPLYSTHFVTTRLPGAVALEGFKPRLLSTGIPSPAHASAAHLGLWQLQKGTRPASSSPEYPRQSKPLPTTDLRPYRTPAPSAQQVIYTLERSNSHLIILHVLSLSI